MLLFSGAFFLRAWFFDQYKLKVTVTFAVMAN